MDTGATPVDLSAMHEQVRTAHRLLITDADSFASRGFIEARRIDAAPAAGKVKGRGAKRAVAVFDTNTDTVARATTIAKKLPESRVVIRKAKGTIQTEYTYVVPHRSCRDLAVALPRTC